ncbi:Plasma membrane low glucose sensor [Naganishia albida]|nr:Plasma membrane low glucose sensor [Naganishia albida]
MSLAGAILSAGTFCGTLFAGPCADLLGRRMGIIASSVRFSLGVGLQLNTNGGAIITGRVTCGKSEVGVIGLYQWCITLGILLAAIVNNSTEKAHRHSGWRIVIALQFLWPAILIVGTFFLVETPRYPGVKGRHDAAKTFLVQVTKLTGLHGDGLETDASMPCYVKDSTPRPLWESLPTRNRSAEVPIECGCERLPVSLFKRSNNLPVSTFIFYFDTAFFKQSGIDDPFVIPIVTNAVNVVSTIPGILVIDRLGRRKMLFGRCSRHERL